MVFCCTSAFPSSQAHADALESLRSLAGDSTPVSASASRLNLAAVAPVAVASESRDPEAVYTGLYGAGRAPQSADIAGNWKGTALVFAKQGPVRLDVFDKLISSIALKLWEGKTFFPNGGGVNRFSLAGERRMFRFATAQKPSLTGLGDALSLDYSANPFPVNAVRDEVRLLPDGRLLGRAYMHFLGRNDFLFFFILERTGNHDQ